MKFKTILKRCWLFIPAGIYEILLLVVSVISVTIMVLSGYVNKYSTKISQNTVDRAKKLPSFAWYIGK